MENIIVQKYGGTSVGDIERIKNVAKRIISYKERGYKPVVVVSAMAGTTDNLIGLAKQITDTPPERELDMLLATGEQVSIALLAMTLHTMGHNAISLNASQVGIYTDNKYTKAKIQYIETKKIIDELNNGKIVIIAGFQGIDSENNITTLGRGGSDTTAVAIAAALKANLCEIYTDVDGVYTADPRIVASPRKLKYITYDEMLELAALGAKVLHSRSVEFAKLYNVIIHVRSSFTYNEGTYVVKETKEMEKVVVRGISVKKDEAKVTIYNVPDKPGIAAHIFSTISSKNINVNVIVQSSSDGKTNSISFTVAKSDLPKLKEIMNELCQEFEEAYTEYNENIAIVSIVGIGMRSHSGIAATMFDILAKAGINIDMISTSEIKISVVISGDEANKAVNLLHDGFKLSKEIDFEGSE